MKKKTILLLACLTLTAFTANAQLGDILNKAARKATQKATEKLTDKAADAAAKSLESKLEQNKKKTTADEDVNEQPASISLMLTTQMPELPSAEQYTRYKEAELNEQTLKLMVSPVTSFQSNILSLSMKIFSQIDSTELTEATYRQAEMSTGLTREELEHLATLPDDQQQAYLQAHYKEGTAQAALIQQAAEASEYLKPIQPLIDQWESFNSRIDDLYKSSDEQCKQIYQRYSHQLNKASDKERNKILIKYYSEIAPIVRNTVLQALQIRLSEQMPVAEQIEQHISSIRAEHPDLFSLSLNYPRNTATLFLAEPAHMLDIPQYSD